MKVLRLQSKGSVPLANSLDWFVSNEYTSNVIQSFPDPDGGKGNEPTSIPSPFARMDLVRIAFKYVNEGYKEDTTFYKIVSDTLDVAEIFYNYERLKDTIRVHEWDRVNDLMKLKTSSLEEHKTLAEAIALYFGQDDTSFNFNHVSKFYFLSYQGKIIGGTSPLTLFIPSGNDLSSIDIRFPNGDRAFDDSYCPLYERDSDFVKMIFDMRRSFPMFATLFKEFSKYLDNTLEQLKRTNYELFLQIDSDNNFARNDYNTSNYNLIPLGVNIINGLPFYCTKNNLDGVKSDFEIESTKFKGRRPLVLKPRHTGMRTDGKTRMRYFRANYDPNIEVPYLDKIEVLEQRKLPGLSGIVYPYITVSDFLEPYLIKTIYPINDRFFFDGLSGITQNIDAFGFLLPLKKRYFDFFDIDDLDKLTHDGRKRFEMILGSQGQVKVIMRVPVANEDYIEYERTYKPALSSRIQTEMANESENKGAIMELHFGISIYPTVVLPIDQDNHYRIGLFESDILPHTKSANYKLKFNKLDGRICKPITVKNRNVKSDRNVNSFHYVINNDVFDYIEIDSGIGAKGLAIPKLKKISNGVNESVFAIDFGTTHTHIEYSVDRIDATPQPFSVTGNDIQIAFLHKPIDLAHLDTQSKSARALVRLLSHFVYETMPELIGGEEFSPYSFPTRTAISSSANLNIFEETFTLADFNIPFFFQKQPYDQQTSINIELNLKWDEENNQNEKHLRHYFESLLMLIRNKAILNNCDLNKTKIVCSYPTSMLRWRRELFERFWTDLYKKYFNQNSKPKFISESIAPYYYLKERSGLNSLNKPVLSIDIGGETTDFVIYIDDKPKIISSARFATNAIFGDGFNYSVSANGFVQHYKPIINNILVNGNYGELLDIIKEAENRANSTDIINSFFALETNALHNPREEVSFSKLVIQGSEFKIVFVIFYAAIIYHISRLMKALNMPAPGYLTFSGMGSKVIRFIDHGGVEKLTNEIIGSVLGESETEIFRNEKVEPKVITAKGGVYFGKEKTESELDEDNKYVLLGETGLTLLGKNHKRTTYVELNEDVYDSVADEFLTFIDLIDNLGKRMDFKNFFGFSHDDLKKYKNVIAKRNKVKEFIIRGVENKKKQLREDTNQPIEETMFFYPLIGGLNRLAYEIYENLNKR